MCRLALKFGGGAADLHQPDIPDLIIIDNAIENDLILFSLDKHFQLISQYIDLKLVEI